MSKRSTRSRRGRQSGKAVRRRRLLVASAKAAGFVALALALYGAWSGWRIAREFEQRGWDVPARVFAAPSEIYVGKPLSADALSGELIALGYRRDGSLTAPGSFRGSNSSIDVHLRAFDAVGTRHAAQVASIAFSGARVARIETQSGDQVAALELEPLLIGSIFPAHGEDRIILEPEAIPSLLTQGLIAVEDRRFADHIGVDIRAIGRAALVNIRQGEIEQGASTLTQQLVRSYFLTTERTWWRKIREAFMAIVLEVRYDKERLMHAYVNEIYLAQDGGRAIHGFGLASRFYFGKPLAELQLHETALLITQVRGPSYYDPRRNPERARQRRDLVLGLMQDRGIISASARDEASAMPLGIVTRAGRRTAYYPAFLDLVRRQLERDYAREDLQRKGLSIYTTLEPSAQGDAESSLATELDRLQPGRPALEGAVIVTNPHTGEIRALVGGRDASFDGFNRALDARRPIGSLIKPAVYLAAIETGRYSLASLVDDAPIDVPLDNGTVWSPQNYDGEPQGRVTAMRALAESLNMATVRLGMDVGVDAVADTLTELGLNERPRSYPSLLLGAIELTPIEVAGLYNTLASGGFRQPLRAVRAVVSPAGEQIQRYRIAIEQTSEPEAVYALNQGLVQVMQRGTGRSAQAVIGNDVTSAGKTGTSDDLRDSWFAGFTNNQLVVTWIGNDSNEPVGLTGSSGAAMVAARVLQTLEPAAYSAPVPRGLEGVSIDYVTGLVTDSHCADAVPAAMPRSELPATARSCGSTSTRIGSRIRSWLRGTDQ